MLYKTNIYLIVFSRVNVWYPIWSLEIDPWSSLKVKYHFPKQQIFKVIIVNNDYSHYLLSLAINNKLSKICLLTIKIIIMILDYMLFVLIYYIRNLNVLLVYL